MKNTISTNERFKRIFFFFPFQLVILHFKKNHLLLVFWLLLIAICTELVGVKYGVPILFLYPEYLGTNDFWAYLVLGFATGGFIVAFNLYSYIMHGFRFPFIASVSRPFLKFSVNNCIIPLIFIVIYLYFSYKFQLDKELLPHKVILKNLSGFLSGIGLFWMIALSYFIRTNRDVSNIHHKNKFRGIQRIQDYSFLQMANRWRGVKQNNRTWRVETYMSHPFKIALARENTHYSDEIIDQVFSQNHINGSIFELLTIISFLLLGSLREVSFFLIPAAASIFLLFTMLLMFISAMYSWFKGWTTSFLILLFALINMVSSRDNFLNIENRAYGINYQEEAKNYPIYLGYGLPTAAEINNDVRYTKQALENWKAKMFTKYGETNPKLFFVNCSGGGLRASLWTLRSLSHLDSVSQGKLFDHTFLITGSSGGMIGAASYRELVLRGKTEAEIEGYFEKLGNDILNPLIFCYATNDLFIRYQSFTNNNNQFTKDRGFAFEKQLNENLDFILSKRIGDYAELEKKALCPLFILSPTIANDGRKLLISASPITYLTKQNIPGITATILPENVCFSHLFKKYQADSIQLTSALRMSATFPYIMPAVTLPTEPKIDIMDAGMRDNFGFTTTAPFIYTFRAWIKENTAGAVVLQLRDLEKKARFSDDINTNFTARMTSPLGTVYNNIFNTQNFAQDEILAQLKLWTDFPFDVLSYELIQEENKPISLSWHLTELEKKQIKAGIELKNNLDTEARMLRYLKTPVIKPKIE